jgi:hypothetical protein
MDDPQEFYCTICSFLEPGELARMKTNALHFVRTEFNWQIQSKPYGQAIRDMIVRESVPESIF